MTKVAVELGLHWVCMDLEQGYLSYQQIAAHLLAACGTDLSVTARPPSHALEPTKRVVDLGAHGIILPLVESADAVRAAHETVFYPQRGVEASEANGT